MLETKHMLDYPEGWRRYLEDKRGEGKAKFPAMCLQITLDRNPDGVMALIQNDGIVEITEKLRSEAETLKNRPVFNQYDADAGWSEARARECYLQWVRKGAKWRDYLMYWAAIQEDPTVAYMKCLEALATYCLKKDFIKDLQGIDQIFDFTHLIDRPNRRQ